jgi:hypothetical protein
LLEHQDFGDAADGSERGERLGSAMGLGKYRKIHGYFILGRQARASYSRAMARVKASPAKGAAYLAGRPLPGS